MTKLSLIEKEKKRKFLCNKYYEKIKNIKNFIKNKNNNEYDKNLARLKLQDIPKNAHSVRLRNRCFITGRARGYFRRFGLCRNMIRDLARKGDIPGIFKASW